MAQISCNQDGVLAVSVGNILQVINSNLNQLIFKYINELDSNTDATNSNFIQHVFSMNNKYFAAVSEDKKLLVWNIVENSLCLSRELLKRPTCLCFCNREDTVVVGDKSGDVYRYLLGDSTTQQHPVPILGHLSMVLDIALSPDDSFIVSADRDEKIRVSFYPNAYSIHSYCLGHLQLVSTVSLLSDDLLVSGSADNTLRLWRFKDGVEMHCADVGSTVQSAFIISKVMCSGNNIAVIGEGLNSVLFFTCNGESLTYESTFHCNDQPYDMCYLGGRLCVLVHNSLGNCLKEIVILEKEGGVYAKQDTLNIDVLKDDAAVSIPVLKYLTNLVKPQSKKRTNIDITPESTITYEVGAKQTRIEG